MIKLDNVILEMHDDGKGGKVEGVVDTYLEPLIEELALKHPEWKFEHENARRKLVEGGGIGWTYERIKITDKYEQLGKIGLDYVRTGKRFWISNHRVEAMRERGSGVKTTDIKKAIRHVEKFFGRKSLDEKLTEAKQLARSVVEDVARDKFYKFRNTWGVLENEARLFIAENIEAFKAATSYPAEAERFTEVVNELEHSNNVRDMLHQSKTYLVFIDGMNYSVSLGQSQPEIMSSEKLPDFIRRGVGMLKLVERGSIITNIGVRVAEDTFIVLPPSEEKDE
jgi:hypothetical protein